jgi:Na+/H+ antiporter
MASLPILALSHFGAHEEVQLVLLLVVAVGLLLLSQPLRIPYPILLVLGGLGIGFVPGVPNVIMPPDVVLYGIVPPLLYSAAFNTGLRELRQNLQAISLLAVGLVTATMVSVAVVGHYAIHLSWAPAFVLGAVVSPTDPLAASAIGRRFGVPRRSLAIIEGESLVNDGTALVLFKFAVAAVVAGSFSLMHAAADFVWSVVGGVAVGLVIGHAIRLIRRRLDNPPLEIMIAFLTGYFTFLPAAAIGVSGVLAVVTAGVYMGWHTPELTTVETRLQGNGFWAILSFVLNSLLFGLVGLQLRPILDRLSGLTAGQLIAYGALAGGAVIVTRILFAFPFTYLRSRRPEGRPPLRNVAFVAWAGMRGAITIAAALAIPLTTNSGAPFPHRDLIVYLAFCVVFATLVVQGLTLPFVIRLLACSASKTTGSMSRRKRRLASTLPTPRWRDSRSSRTRVSCARIPRSACVASMSSAAIASAHDSTTRTTVRSKSARSRTNVCAASSSTRSVQRSSGSATRAGSPKKSCTAWSATSISRTAA